MHIILQVNHLVFGSAGYTVISPFLKTKHTKEKELRKLYGTNSLSKIHLKISLKVMIVF